MKTASTKAHVTLEDAELAVFRTRVCEQHRNGTCRNSDRCPHSHCQTWQRRNPTEYTYSSKLCPEIEFVKRESKMTLVRRCSRGRACCFAHSKEEELYHPTMYKTKMCNSFPYCTRYHCPFAHSVDELRKPGSRPLHARPACLSASGGQDMTTTPTVAAAALHARRTWMSMDSAALTSVGQPAAVAAAAPPLNHYATDGCLVQLHHSEEQPQQQHFIPQQQELVSDAMPAGTQRTNVGSAMRQEVWDSSSVAGNSKGKQAEPRCPESPMSSSTTASSVPSPVLASLSPASKSMVVVQSLGGTPGARHTSPEPIAPAASCGLANNAAASQSGCTEDDATTTGHAWETVTHQQNPTVLPCRDATKHMSPSCIETQDSTAWTSQQKSAGPCRADAWGGSMRHPTQHQPSMESVSEEQEDEDDGTDNHNGRCPAPPWAPMTTTLGRQTAQKQGRCGRRDFYNGSSHGEHRHRQLGHCDDGVRRRRTTAGVWRSSGTHLDGREVDGGIRGPAAAAAIAQHFFGETFLPTASSPELVCQELFNLLQASSTDGAYLHHDDSSSTKQVLRSADGEEFTLLPRLSPVPLGAGSAEYMSVASHRSSGTSSPVTDIVNVPSHVSPIVPQHAPVDDRHGVSAAGSLGIDASCIVDQVMMHLDHGLHTNNDGTVIPRASSAGGCCEPSSVEKQEEDGEHGGVSHLWCRRASLHHAPTCPAATAVFLPRHMLSQWDEETLTSFFSGKTNVQGTGLAAGNSNECLDTASTVETIPQPPQYGQHRVCDNVMMMNGRVTYMGGPPETAYHGHHTTSRDFSSSTAAAAAAAAPDGVRPNYSTTVNAGRPMTLDLGMAAAGCSGLQGAMTAMPHGAPGEQMRPENRGLLYGRTTTEGRQGGSWGNNNGQQELLGMMRWHNPGLGLQTGGKRGGECSSSTKQVLLHDGGHCSQERRMNYQHEKELFHSGEEDDGLATPTTTLFSNFSMLFADQRRSNEQQQTLPPEHRTTQDRSSVSTTATSLFGTEPPPPPCFPPRALFMPDVLEAAGAANTFANKNCFDQEQATLYDDDDRRSIIVEQHANTQSRSTGMRYHNPEGWGEGTIGQSNTSTCDAGFQEAFMTPQQMEGRDASSEIPFQGADGKLSLSSSLFMDFPPCLPVAATPSRMGLTRGPNPHPPRGSSPLPVHPRAATTQVASSALWAQDNMLFRVRPAAQHTIHPYCRTSGPPDGVAAVSWHQYQDDHQVPSYPAPIAQPLGFCFQ